MRTVTHMLAGSDTRLTIVCGVSGAPSTPCVLDAAVTLSEQFEADLVVVHVASGINPQGEGIAPPFDPDAYRTGALERGAAILRREAREVLEAGARGRVEIGATAPRLAAVAQDESASLLVIGCRRRRLLRNVAAAVVRRAVCPVLVIPSTARAGDGR